MGVWCEVEAGDQGCIACGNRAIVAQYIIVRKHSPFGRATLGLMATSYNGPLYNIANRGRRTPVKRMYT